MANQHVKYDSSQDNHRKPFGPATDEQTDICKTISDCKTLTPATRVNAGPKCNSKTHAFPGAHQLVSGVAREPALGVKAEIVRVANHVAVLGRHQSRTCLH